MGLINTSFIDWPWSAIHFISGACIGVVLALMKQKTAMFSLIIGFGLLLSWEIFEGVLWLTYSRGLGIANSFQRVIPSVFFEYETIANIAGDMVIGTLGLIVGYWAESYFRKQS